MTGVFDDDRYFDVFVEYAKAGPEDILVRITVHNRGPEAARLHVLPTLWFRNTWSWGIDDRQPALRAAEGAADGDCVIEASHTELDTYRLYCDARPGLLLVVFVSAFQLMIDKGRELDWFASPFIVGSAIVTVIALGALVIWELTDEDPVLDFSVFRSRNWLVSTVSLALMFGLFFGNIVLTPLWLQQMMGYTATWAGYATAPMGILAVVTAPIVGRLMAKIDPRIIVTYGMTALAASFFMRAHLNAQAEYFNIAISMFVLGAGVPACLVTLTSLAVSDLPPEKVANASGLQNFIRIMAMAVGASLAVTYWENAAKASRADLVAIIDPATTLTAPSSLPATSVLALFSKMVDAQAVMLATNNFYAMATVLILIFAAVVWLAKRPKGPLKQVSH